MSNVQLLENKGIRLKGKTFGEMKTLCPKCSESRKNKREPCLSVNITEGVYNCHNCDFKGSVNHRPEKTYQKPAQRVQKVSQKIVDYFGGRGISNNTLLRFQITESREYFPSLEKHAEAICFNYFRNGELVNIKFRGTGKAFTAVSGAELILYNLDAISGLESALIAEGEIDCLSFYEAGVHDSVSVPNGASTGSLRLEYLDNCFEYFEGKKRIVLATDNDPAGLALREELARRLGKERCWKVEYPEGCKDANEVLVKHGKQAVKDLADNAIPWPVDGLIAVEDMYEDILGYYDKGYPPGYEVGVKELDELIKFMSGQLTVVTGIPGSGKSEMIDWFMTRLSERHGWSWAVCSFENQPSSIHATKLMEKFAGKSFAYRNNEIYRMTITEADEAVEKVRKYFTFINLAEVDVSVGGILAKARELVVRKGINGLIIDPWNYLEHRIPQGYTETQYISEALTELKQFALKYGVHIFLIAHPTKISKDANGKYVVPTLYSIAGSAHFFNKSDNGMTVYRDFDTNVVTVYVQKIRFSWLGKIGHAEFEYNTLTRQYKVL